MKQLQPAEGQVWWPTAQSAGDAVERAWLHQRRQTGDLELDFPSEV